MFIEYFTQNSTQEFRTPSTNDELTFQTNNETTHDSLLKTLPFEDRVPLDF
jgi:hypothetical protein